MIEMYDAEYYERNGDEYKKISKDDFKINELVIELKHIMIVSGADPIKVNKLINTKVIPLLQKFTNEIKVNK